MNCPFCDRGRDKGKFAVQFAYDMGKCWECNYRERLVQFIIDYEGVEYKQARAILNDQEESYLDFTIVDFKREVEKSNVLLPKGFIGLLDGEGVISDRARNTLLNRGFDLEALDMMGFGYCVEHGDNFETDYFGYIIIPFKKKGVLQYYIGRAFLGQDPKYKNPGVGVFGVGKEELFYNEDALDLYDEVFLLEGAFDSICTGKNAIASLGWSLSPIQQSKILKSDIKRLIITPDKGYYKTAVKTAMTFIDEKEVVVINMDNVLPDQKEKKDVNEIGIELVLEEYGKTPVLTNSMAMDILMS